MRSFCTKLLYRITNSFDCRRFFLDDDEKLEEIKENYTSGKLLTGELKKFLIDVLTPVLTKHQEIRSQITDDTLQMFMTPRKLCWYKLTTGICCITIADLKLFIRRHFTIIKCNACSLWEMGLSHFVGVLTYFQIQMDYLLSIYFIYVWW